MLILLLLCKIFKYQPGFGTTFVDCQEHLHLLFLLGILDHGVQLPGPRGVVTGGTLHHQG